jgi:hypothetical protein
MHNFRSKANYEAVSWTIGLVRASYQQWKSAQFIIDIAERSTPYDNINIAVVTSRRFRRQAMIEQTL